MCDLGRALGLHRNSTSWHQGSNWWSDVQQGNNKRSEGKKGGKGKGTEVRKGVVDPNPPSLEARFKEAVERREGPTDETDFEERIAALKKTSAVLAKEKVGSGEVQGIFASGGDAYANPPSILETLSKKEDDPDKVSPLGNQVAVVAGTLVLGAVLIFSSIDPGGGDFISRTETISPEEKTQLQTQLDGFTAALASNPDDTEALEGAAVTNANLQNYKASEELLVRLTKAKGDDPDVWRLLAETRSALNEPGKAAAAYAEALKLRDGDLQILKGYCGALVAAGKPADAVAEIKSVSERLRARDVASTSAGLLGRADAPTDVGTSEASSTPAASAAAAFDAASATPIELDLLLAKVYSQWRGHTTEALQTYDAIIEQNPSDFRGYLAKGVLLRSEGRKSDADRAFMQARFMAPPKLRSIVDKVAAPEDPI